MNLLDPTEFSTEWQKLKRDFDEARATIENNRKVRKNKVDVIALRKKGTLNAAQTYVGVRVIDENIQRDVPTYLAFIKQSRRLGLFTPIGVAGIQVEPLEMAITDNMRYSGWEVDYIRLTDGGLLHGWDIVEVVYDAAKPGHVAVNHIGADNLMFSRQYENIDQSPMVARAFTISPVDLEAYVRSGTFDNPPAVDKLRQLIQNSNTPGNGNSANVSPFKVYRALFKHEGIVNETWYSDDINEALSKPRPFFNGRYSQIQTPIQTGGMSVDTQPSWQPATETSYPYVMFFTSINEEKKIAEQVGHADKSYYLQDAMCVLQSAGVNGAIQASNVMWSPEGSDYTTSGKPAVYDMPLKNGAVWNKPMRGFSAPYPDPMLFRALDALDTRNATANNKLAFAVNNRQDSRKTAKEITSAEQQTSQISSVQVLYLSIPMREIIKRAYEIMKIAWLRGEIRATFDLGLLQHQYEIQSAGDIDFIQRQETIQAMQQDWPIVGTTPAASVFLNESLQMRSPSLAPQLIAAHVTWLAAQEKLKIESEAIRQQEITERAATKMNWAIQFRVWLRVKLRADKNARGTAIKMAIKVPNVAM